MVRNGDRGVLLGKEHFFLSIAEINKKSFEHTFHLKSCVGL